MLPAHRLPFCQPGSRPLAGSGDCPGPPFLDGSVGLGLYMLIQYRAWKRRYALDVMEEAKEPWRRRKTGLQFMLMAVYVFKFRQMNYKNAAALCRLIAQSPFLQGRNSTPVGADLPSNFLKVPGLVSNEEASIRAQPCGPQILCSFHHHQPTLILMSIFKWQRSTYHLPEIQIEATFVRHRHGQCDIFIWNIYRWKELKQVMEYWRLMPSFNMEKLLSPQEIYLWDNLEICVCVLKMSARVSLISASP